ncbi:hypothetical protein GCM10008934_16410 [Virgibacillus salarius]|uniref:hypothetical protein n=1 Tax=Virgibacillus salarius TaxID=447199 RepID=UPI0031DBD8C5
MSEIKQVTRFTRVVYSTEELSELQRAVEQAGGQIVGNHAMRNGRGISVTIEVDPKKRNF